MHTQYYYTTLPNTMLKPSVEQQEIQNQKWVFLHKIIICLIFFLFQTCFCPTPLSINLNFLSFLSPNLPIDIMSCIDFENIFSQTVFIIKYLKANTTGIFGKKLDY